MQHVGSGGTQNAIGQGDYPWSGSSLELINGFYLTSCVCVPLASGACSFHLVPQSQQPGNATESHSQEKEIGIARLGPPVLVANQQLPLSQHCRLSLLGWGSCKMMQRKMSNATRWQDWHLYNAKPCNLTLLTTCSERLHPAGLISPSFLFNYFLPWRWSWNCSRQKVRIERWRGTTHLREWQATEDSIACCIKSL